MRRELQILQWSVVGMISPDELLFLWTIRLRMLQNNGRTASTNDIHVETINVQSSPPEPPVASSRSEAAATFVRVSDAVPSPSSQKARYRHHVNVTPTLPREALLSCLHRSHQLLLGSNAVSVDLTCLECVTTQNGLYEPDPHSRNFQSPNKWYKRIGQNCNDGKGDVSLCVESGSDVLLGPFDARDSRG